MDTNEKMTGNTTLRIRIQLILAPPVRGAFQDRDSATMPDAIALSGPWRLESPVHT
jgi:hypothetical protein